MEPRGEQFVKELAFAVKDEPGGSERRECDVRPAKMPAEAEAQGRQKLHRDRRVRRG